VIWDQFVFTLATAELQAPDGGSKCNRLTAGFDGGNDVAVAVAAAAAVAIWMLGGSTSAGDDYNDDVVRLLLMIIMRRFPTGRRRLWLWLLAVATAVVTFVGAGGCFPGGLDSTILSLRPWVVCLNRSKFSDL
jgi:hypothetical protein